MLFHCLRDLREYIVSSTNFSTISLYVVGYGLWMDCRLCLIFTLTVDFYDKLIWFERGLSINSDEFMRIFSVFNLLTYNCSLIISDFEMDLEIENYEADLADFQLQDSPFYEAPTTAFVFDSSMTSLNRLSFSGPTSVSAGKLSGKGAANMAENSGTRGIIGASSVHENTLELSSSFGFTSKFDEPPKKKNRKCVRFLPNYVQVSIGWSRIPDYLHFTVEDSQLGICFIIDIPHMKSLNYSNIPTTSIYLYSLARHNNKMPDEKYPNISRTKYERVSLLCGRIHISYPRLVVSFFTPKRISWIFIIPTFLNAYKYDNI